MILLKLLQHKACSGRLARQRHHRHHLGTGGLEFHHLLVRTGQQGQFGIALADIDLLAVVAQVQLK